MANKVQAVVFDYKAVFQAGTTPHPDMAQLLHVLDQQGVAWVLMTTQSIDAAALCSAAGLPQPALHLSQEDIPGRKNRGSGLWLDQAAERLGLRKNQLVIVGTTEWDWMTGINAGVLYVHARWASALGRTIDALVADDPTHLYWQLERHLLHEPEWLFALDDAERRLRVRSLFQPDETFPGTSPSFFNLKTVFTYDKEVTVGDGSARDILMVHLLCSAYLDGSLPNRAWFCVYPSSTPGRVNDQLAEFLEVAKVMVGSYYRGDLLVRACRRTCLCAEVRTDERAEQVAARCAHRHARGWGGGPLLLQSDRLDRDLQWHRDRHRPHGAGGGMGPGNWNGACSRPEARRHASRHGLRGLLPP
ncbi:hypothetical protein ABZ351_33375 [Streptomyces microflavus]|uniref:HAD family hydrolase n=1 Tax=Streptomyces microflavus TaxID=1919 RepID=UPI00340CEA2E